MVFLPMVLNDRCLTLNKIANAVSIEGFEDITHSEHGMTKVFLGG